MISRFQIALVLFVVGILGIPTHLSSAPFQKNAGPIKYCSPSFAKVLTPDLKQSGSARAFGFAPQAQVRTVKRAETHLNQLRTLSEFEQLAKSVRTGGGEQKVVKIVYDRRDGKRIPYFINTNDFSYHIEFSMQVLGYNKGLAEFNRNYLLEGDKREFNLVSLVLSPGAGKDKSDQWLLEMWTGDTLSGKSVEELYEAISSKLPNGTKLLFHPLSHEQEEMVKTSKPNVPFVTTRELYKDKPYWPLNEGVAYGYVKFVKHEEGVDPLLDLTDIAVFDRVPNDIGLVGGVITEEFQTPLSHVNVKSMNRGTVNLSLRDAKTELAKYEGKPVELNVGPNGYEVRLLPETEAAKLIADFWAERKPKLPGKISSIHDPRYDKEFVRLDGYYKRRPTKAQHSKMIQTVGAKAANLGLIDKVIRQLQKTGIKGIESPGTIGVSFNHFDSFMDLKQKGLDSAKSKRSVSPRALILEILEREKLLDTSVIHPVAKTRPALEEIQGIIKKAKIPPHILKLFKKYIMEDETSPIYYKKVSKIRLRSSTNSEDIEGFTGAGLYNSTGVRLYKKEKGDDGEPVLRKWEKIEEDLIEAIGFVYSSAWNERAFFEREWFNMNGTQHTDVKVGIAVHGGFPAEQANGEVGEVANGVAITQNIFNPEEEAHIYINGQHYDFSITNPPTKEELAERGEKGSNIYETEELMVTTLLADETGEDRPDSWSKWPIETLKNSSLNDGKPVLSPLEAHKLALILRFVSDEMAMVFGQDPASFAIDAEWKVFGKDRKISLKQARPFSKSTQ